MPLTIKHAFTSIKTDGTDNSVVKPSNWNEDHVITGFLDAAPVGPSGAVQFNDADVLSGDAGFTYDPVSGVLINAAITENAGTTVGLAVIGTIPTNIAAARWEGLEINNPDLGDSATLTTAWGILMGDITAADNNWAIKTGLGLVEIGDQVFAGAPAPVRATSWGPHQAMPLGLGAFALNAISPVDWGYSSIVAQSDGYVGGEFQVATKARDGDITPDGNPAVAGSIYQIGACYFECNDTTSTDVAVYDMGFGFNGFNNAWSGVVLLASGDGQVGIGKPVVSGYTDGIKMQIGSATLLLGADDSATFANGKVHIGPAESTLPAIVQGWTAVGPLTVISESESNVGALRIVSSGVNADGFNSLFYVSGGNGTAIEGDVVIGADASEVAAFVAYLQTEAGVTSTDNYGFHCVSFYKDNGTDGNFTNIYGLKIDDQTFATNNWAIKTGKGLVEFGNNGDAAGTVGLHVMGNGAFDVDGAGSKAALWLDTDDQGAYGLYISNRVSGIGNGAALYVDDASTFHLGVNGDDTELTFTVATQTWAFDRLLSVGAPGNAAGVSGLHVMGNGAFDVDGTGKTAQLWLDADNVPEGSYSWVITDRTAGVSKFAGLGIGDSGEIEFDVDGGNGGFYYNPSTGDWLFWGPTPALSSIQAPSLITSPFTVATLPVSPTAGQRAFVTDSNAVSFTAGIGAIVAAGGSTGVPVIYDGTHWRIG